MCDGMHSGNVKHRCILMKCEVKPFEALSTKELFEIYKLRSQVFVVEQNCVYQDVDDEDLSAFHVMATKAEDLVGYARLYKSHSEAKIGRVVIAQNSRSQGFGSELMKYCLMKCKEIFPAQQVCISAQQYLLSFYNGLGFVAEGDGYLEDGIPHLRMVFNPKEKTLF